MSNLETNGSPQLELVRSFILGIEKGDMDEVGKTMHKDHRRFTYPRSLGKPVQTKEEYLQHAGAVISRLKDHKLTSHSVIETPGKVVVHLTASAKAPFGVDMIREMIFTAHIVTDEDDGSLKIMQADEFTDSKSYLDFFNAMEEGKAKGEHPSSYAA